MNLFRNMQSDRAQNSGLLSAIMRFLPIVIAAILITVLSGGFPPANWTVLAEVLIHWRTLSAQQNLALPLIILIVQSLLLLFVWCALIWITLREVKVMRTGVDVLDEDDEISAAELTFLNWFQRKPAIKQEDEDEEEEKKRGALVPVTNIRPGAKAAAKKRAAQKTTTNTPATAITIKGTPAVVMEPEILKNPFEQENIADQKSAPVQPPPVKKQIKQASASQAPGSAPVPAPKPTPKSKSKDPFDVQYDVLNIFQNPDLLDDDIPLPKSQPGKKAQIPENKPVPARVDHNLDADVDLDDFANAEEPEEIKEDNEFVFGNPFEGPLPEIFQYDTDLKKSLKDIGQEVKEPKPTQKMTTKKRETKSGANGTTTSNKRQ